MGLRLLSSHIPNTLRYNKEADPVCKGVFRSTLFPPDPRQEKDSGLPELVEAAFFGRDPGITLL